LELLGHLLGFFLVDGPVFVGVAALEHALLDPLGHFVFADLAVAVAVEAHQALDETPAAGSPATAAGTGTPEPVESFDELLGFLAIDGPIPVGVAALKGALHPLRQFLTGDLAVAVFIQGHQSLDREAPGATSTRAAPTGNTATTPAGSATSTGATPTGTTRSTGAAPATRAGGATRATEAAGTGRSAGAGHFRAKLLATDSAIAIFVELLQGLDRALDLLGLDLAVLVGVERDHQRHA
jgi:hypothetical protein